MSELKCPFCQQELECCGIYIDGTKKLLCDNCKLFGDNRLFEKLIRTSKELEQSEICCTEWEKQALDYKAENIALSGDLERTRKAAKLLKEIKKLQKELKQKE